MSIGRSRLSHEYSRNRSRILFDSRASGRTAEFTIWFNRHSGRSRGLLADTGCRHGMCVRGCGVIFPGAGKSRFKESAISREEPPSSPTSKSRLAAVQRSGPREALGTGAEFPEPCEFSLRYARPIGRLHLTPDRPRRHRRYANQSRRQRRYADRHSDEQ